MQERNRCRLVVGDNVDRLPRGTVQDSDFRVDVSNPDLGTICGHGSNRVALVWHKHGDFLSVICVVYVDCRVGMTNPQLIANYYSCSDIRLIVGDPLI
jgi:hypothetical protein